METVTETIVADHDKIIQGLRHRLILRRLDELFENVAGEQCRYQLHYLWYNASNGVQGDEYTYWTTKFMRPIIAKLEDGDTLFDHFNLF